MTALTSPHLQHEPTAIVPNRVLILSEAEQHQIAHAMAYLAKGDDMQAARLRDRVAYGDEYDNAVDELARTTLRKRVLESATRRANGRIELLKEQVIEDLLDRGEDTARHAATGATLRITRKVWAKVRRQGEKVTDQEKAAAARALEQAGLGDFVQPGFNTNSVSAYFREQIKEYDEIQRSLPEDQRVPRPASSFLPAGLEDTFELTDDPDISVTAPRS